MAAQVLGKALEQALRRLIVMQQKAVAGGECGPELVQRAGDRVCDAKHGPARKKAQPVVFSDRPLQRHLNRQGGLFAVAFEGSGKPLAFGFV